MTNIAHMTSGSSTIASYAYTYNSDGRKTQETLADGSYYSYGYDSAGQVTSESLNSGGSGTVGAPHGYGYTYTYDAAGNRATKYDGTSTENYTYDNANKLTSAGVKSYSYDYNGNCTSVYNSTSGVTVTLGYDGESRMTLASDSASVFSNTYSYNGLDQRVGKVDNGGTFAYTRDGDAVDSSVLADGAAVYNHGAGGNGLVSEVRGGTTSKYYHSDALGSTGALTNSSGTTTDTHVSDAFGMTVAGSGSTPTPFGFVGQGGYQSDSDTGLTLCGYRYYDSSTGRFLSRDPAQMGNNWYAYCNNDPANNIDPLGLAGCGLTAGYLVGAGLGPDFSIGSTGSVGAGFFTNGPGAYASGGSYANWPNGSSCSSPTGGGGSFGIFGGLGIGPFFTNADKVSDLKKTTGTVSFDLSIIWNCLPVSGSIQISYQNPIKSWLTQGIGIWSVSLTAGPGLGALLTHLQTTTVTTGN